VTAELPELDETRCVGSANCVAVCPTDCLAMAGGRPWLPRPADCISCNLCVIVCPTSALRLVKTSAEK
jgi:NAD-dependent dihydropyrimidine dehydrogenase PreA subunit